MKWISQRAHSGQRSEADSQSFGWTERDVIFQLRLPLLRQSRRLGSLARSSSELIWSGVDLDLVRVHHQLIIQGPVHRPVVPLVGGIPLPVMKELGQVRYITDPKGQVILSVLPLFFSLTKSQTEAKMAPIE
jgi:hypothetical protein